MPDTPSEDSALATIDELVAEEHRLRGHGSAITADDRERLAEIERRLDRCWDVLRRRRAAVEYPTGTDAGEAPGEQQVHDYLQ